MTDMQAMLMYMEQDEGVSLIENENGDACLVMLAIIFCVQRDHICEMLRWVKGGLMALFMIMSGHRVECVVEGHSLAAVVL